MRICLVSYEYPPETADGGIGTQTWNKAQGLARLGHDVHVLSCASGRAQPSLSVRDAAGVKVYRMRRPGDDPAAVVTLHTDTAFLVGYTWSVLANLTRMLAEWEFDLVNFPEYGAEGAAFLLNRTPYNWVPAVVQLHAPLAMLSERLGWPDRDSSHYRVATCLEGESIRLADGLMASSANIADFVAGFYGVDRDPIEVVHCGVDCTLFRPREHQRPDGEVTVLFVGNIARNKGIETVLEAVLRLHTRYPDLRLRVVGKDNELKTRLAARAQKSGAGDRIEWLPFVKERSEIVALYQETDLFAAPADNENGVANVYVEAMACGCPVIAGDNGGSAEAVEDGVSGMLVRPCDVEATEAAIEVLIRDAARRRRMGEAARRRAVEYFAQERYVGRVIRAYENTIARSRDRLARLRAEHGA